jgi:hypothetical protein
VIGTDGIRRDANPDPAGTDRLLEVAASHRDRTGQSFVDAVARDLLAEVTHEEDFTILGIEMAGA